VDDIFEEFRNMEINDYKLDQANYLTAPSLFNDALYYKRKMNVQNIVDIDMLLLVEQAKLVGFAQSDQIDM